MKDTIVFAARAVPYLDIFKIEELPDGYTVILTLRSAQFAERVNVTGFKSVDEIYGEVFVSMENFEGGQRPYCVIKRSGMVQWISNDRSGFDDIILLLKNKELAANHNSMKDIRAIARL